MRFKSPDRCQRGAAAGALAEAAKTFNEVARFGGCSLGGADMAAGTSHLF